MHLPETFPPRIFRQAGVLLLAALAPALLTATLHPRRPAWAKDQIMIPEAAWSTIQEWRDPVLLIDARSAADFSRDHIPGALPLSESQWEEQLPTVIQAWRPGARVVVYCANPGCGTSQSAGRRLRRELGSNTIFVLKGGWSAWLETHSQER
ncbi:MAG: rhodanese-like domain-containing protein [Opitutaceae bacterium]|nr:rhodanese-like domain-containing protein [Opitutaceae bacterium]